MACLALSLVAMQAPAARAHDLRTTPGTSPEAAIVDIAETAGDVRKRRSGTAFAVSRDQLVTNHHLVHGCTDIAVAKDGIAYRAELLAVDAATDLAALQVPDALLRPLELAPFPQELGESVTVIGYPLTSILGEDLRVSTGIVAALRGPRGDATTMQISAPVQPGNSGGPVLDQSGHVVGVVARKLESRGVENVSFAIRAETVRAFLLQSGVHVHAPRLRPVSAASPVVQAVRRAAPSVWVVQCM